MSNQRNGTGEAVRFAVVGLGHFAQTAILPAFAAAKPAQLVALFSSDATKLAEMRKRYRIKDALPYEEYDAYLERGGVDAVFIALPNDLHCEYTVRAAARKVHVLCEKPMAVTSQEGERMIAACDSAGVKLMIAYRLHFDEANLAAVELIKDRELGEARYFSSAFSQQVTEGNIRISAERGGGPIYDIGIYCINAARYLFGTDPTQVMAMRASLPGDERFREVDEQMAVVMRFPDERLASFVCGFGAAKESVYDVVCTEGRLRLDPAYDHARPLRLEVTRGTKGETKGKSFRKRDQVAAEISYFAKCIRRDQDPEPSGRDGLADLRIIEAIHESAKRNAPVTVRTGAEDEPRPTQAQSRTLPSHGKPKTINVQPPSR